MPDYASFPEGMLEKWAEVLPSSSIAEVFKWSEIMPLQRRRELHTMLEIGSSWDTEVYMEIGADKGGTLFSWLVDNRTLKKVIACEYRGTPYKELFEKHFPHIQFLWLEGSSHVPQAKAQVEEFLEGRTIDCLFIDGDKNAFDQDFDMYLPLITRGGGMIFIHDIYDRSGKSPCAKVFRELAKKYTCSTIINLTESVMAKHAAELEWESSGCYEDWLRAGGDDCGLGVFYF